MSKELKVVYEDIKTKYKVMPAEMVVEKDKGKYKRAKKKEKDRELAKDYLGSERWMEIQITEKIIRIFEDYLIDMEESDNTIKQYKYSLKTYKEEIGTKLNKINFKKYKEILLTKRKPKTVNVRIAGIIKFIKFYAEYNKDKRYEEIIIKNVKMQNKTYLNNVISLWEFKKMYEYVKNTKRDKYYYLIKFMRIYRSKNKWSCKFRC